MDQEQAVAANDFDAGYEGLDTLTETPAAEPEAAQEVVEPPKLAAITEEDYQKLKAELAEVGQIKANYGKTFDKAFGKIGVIEQSLNERLNAKPANVKFSPDAFKRLANNFPELSEALAEDLNEALQTQIQVTGNSQLDQSQIDQLVNQRLGSAITEIQTKVEQATETKLLTRQHRDWKEIVAKDEFKQWVTTQPHDFQKELADSWDSQFIGDAIDKFKARKPAVKAPQNTRQRRIEAAVMPRGTGGTSASTSELDEFESGYSS